MMEGANGRRPMSLSGIRTTNDLWETLYALPAAPPSAPSLASAYDAAYGAPAAGDPAYGDAHGAIAGNDVDGALAWLAGECDTDTMLTSVFGF